MVKHQIQTTAGQASYKLMTALVDIHRGEEILAEVPLARLKIGLSDTHDPKRFFGPKSIYSGAKCLERMRSSMPQHDLDRLMALHNKDPKSSLIGLISTNAFGDDELEDGQTYVVLRIYDEISRVNHSCEPNAVMESDSGRGMGVLRALRRITTGEEIFINYLMREEFSLASQEVRRETLSKYWGFECSCSLCSLRGNRRVTNDHQRNEALKRFKILIKDWPHRSSWQTENKSRMDRLPKATEYIGYLNQLDIVDSRLSWAYEKLADIHEELYDIARNSVPAGQSHCDECRNQGGRRWHLDQAKDAYDRKLVVDLRVFGPEHAEVKATQQHLLSIATNRQYED